MCSFSTSARARVFLTPEHCGAGRSRADAADYTLCRMFQLSRPTAAQVAAFLAAQRGREFSYRELGATRSGRPPAGYTVDRNRVRLGVGAPVYRQAVAALRSWRMSSLGWSTTHHANAALAPGETVAVVVRHYGFWSMNACRIVYVLDEETEAVRRTGFAYGTLLDHAEIGEERFVVEWQHADDSVWYDLYAFSRPGHVLARLGYPLGRRLQKRFARESKQAMLAATREHVSP
jgi:uncharacterized protein (UPF0548 family)